MATTLKFNPGELDTPINFERPVNTTGSHGQKVAAWHFVTQVWGKVDWGVESDVSETVRVAGEQYISVTIRWREGITRSMRLKINDEYYYISGVGAIGRRQYMVIDATIKK